MKYIITGSIGHISKPIVLNLINAGHEVTVITSSAEREAAILSLGAKAAVGSIENRDFLTSTFNGADVVYLMVPPKWTVTDWLGYQKEVVDNYIAAITANHIKYAVVLSSLGAHMRKGAGPIDGLGYLEEAISKLTNLNTFVLRPSYFYYNLFSQIGMIKQAGFMGATQPASFKNVLVHTNDIANILSEKLLALDFTGYSINNFASDDRYTWAEITSILGKAIGKPDLPYVELSDEQARGGMLQAGLNPIIAEGYIEMGQANRNEKLQEDYWKNLPKVYGKIKLEDFAKEFAAAYNAS